jgi:hypothetical protein
MIMQQRAFQTTDKSEIRTSKQARNSEFQIHLRRTAIPPCLAFGGLFRISIFGFRISSRSSAIRWRKGLP